MSNDVLIQILIDVIKIVILLFGVLTAVAYLSLAERRVSAVIQDRLGPNRVGPFGLLQPLADGIKFMWKEDFSPARVDKFLFFLAPAMILIPSLLTFAVIPFGDTITIKGYTIPLRIIDLNVGILYFLGMTSVGVYGIALGGWGSNNKYTLLGGIRSSAQMISYELALGLSIVGVLMLSGSLQLPDIIRAQMGSYAGFIPKWNIVRQPLGFLVFVVAAFAENNRLPFDLAEAEQELVAGYHSEYSSMKFSMFMIAEYANMTAASALIVVLFFGGWHVPGLFRLGLSPLTMSLVGLAAFLVKTGVFLFIYIWVRWTLPRFRYDQLMGLGWKVMLPLALFNIVATAGIML
ncbi:MAG: NADH-quinone oxidoreductase subunit NuoH, partial [Candidatus Latescibacteria bacterium]|nr:NADH-quinone oxidoreductase subunit NuoH [Candidatus Latescibacterota bacterium]